MFHMLITILLHSLLIFWHFFRVNVFKTFTYPAHMVSLASDWSRVNM